MFVNLQKPAHDLLRHLYATYQFSHCAFTCKKSMKTYLENVFLECSTQYLALGV